VTKSRGINRPRWRPTEQQLERLREAFATTRTQELADEFGATYSAVAKRASEMGLRKSEAWLAGPAGGRLDGVRGMGSRFQPGHVPWTKGRKGVIISPSTVFKPGHRPHNAAALGSLRIGPSGYLQIKVRETGYPPHDWMMYHRYVWEQAHGPVPEGHLIAWKDQRQRSADPEQIRVELLECVSRAEHGRRNSVHRHGPEIAQLSRLRGVLTRILNRQEEVRDGGQ
jgi:hypothetical protein